MLNYLIPQDYRLILKKYSIVIEKYINLNNEQEQKVKALIAECEAYDHSVVPVQLDHSLNYFPGMASWFLCFEGGILTGVLSVFNPLSDTAELSGCVKPGSRDQGKFRELIVVCSEELNNHKIKTVLLVVDQDSKPGMGLAGKLDLKRDHTEYLMQYGPFKEKYDTPLRFRDARQEDIDTFIRINSALFHESAEESRNIILACLSSQDRKVYVAGKEDEIIGICTLFYSGNKVTIYGLGIDEKHQGKGYGFDLVQSVFNLLKDTPYELELEVDSLNEKAYNLYKKAGFKETRVVHYFEKELWELMPDGKR